jgi:anti-anti-sigma factor
MDIHEHHQNSIWVMQISGQVDSTTAPLLGEKLDAVIDQGHAQLVLDLNNVPYISSAGLRVLSIALKKVRTPEMGGDVCLACLSPTVQHAFRISGFNQVFTIYDSVAEAIAALDAAREIDLS